jgi:hypothetical protein
MLGEMEASIQEVSGYSADDALPGGTA